MTVRLSWLSFAALIASACGGGDSTPVESAGDVQTVEPAGGEEVADPTGSAEGTNDGNFAITAAPQGAVTVGAAGRAEVTLEGRNGYHVNAEYPIQLTIQPPAGVELAKATLVREDASTFEEARAVFPVVFTPREAGHKEFAGELSFSVCNPQNCLMERRPVTFAVDVP